MILLLTEGQVSDYRGAERMLPALPDANTLLADRGYDSNWFREALAARDIEPCIPGRKNRKEPIEYDTELYKQRNRIERMFGRLKDWHSPLSLGPMAQHGSSSQPDTTDAHTPS